MNYKLIVPSNLFELNDSIILENEKHYWLGIASLRKHRLKRILKLCQKEKSMGIKTSM